jgi:hypothetical protein
MWVFRKDEGADYTERLVAGSKGTLCLLGARTARPQVSFPFMGEGGHTRAQFGISAAKPMGYMK